QRSDEIPASATSSSITLHYWCVSAPESLPELRFELAASFQIEALNGINGFADIVFGNVRSQELRGRGIRYYCRHGALPSADVSDRIAEIRPDRLDEVLRTTAGVAHNARQAGSHCLVDD